MLPQSPVSDSTISYHGGSPTTGRYIDWSMRNHSLYVKLLGYQIRCLYRWTWLLRRSAFQTGLGYLEFQISGLEKWHGHSKVRPNNR